MSHRQKEKHTSIPGGTWRPAERRHIPLDTRLLTGVAMATRLVGPLFVSNFSAMRVMKMENSVPRARMEHRSLAFEASVLSIILPRLPDVTTERTPTCLCSSHKLLGYIFVKVLQEARDKKNHVNNQLDC